MHVSNVTSAKSLGSRPKTTVPLSKRTGLQPFSRQLISPPKEQLSDLSADTVRGHSHLPIR